MPRKDRRKGEEEEKKKTNLCSDWQSSLSRENVWLVVLFYFSRLPPRNFLSRRERDFLVLSRDARR